ncbi:uncharacterized protein LOC126380104 [Pectinophora gossypiella]|uniref:uncharacterized protein LOC126380104 n=1 Tax=Pectinophora gossypiella TaxID=13191 RepID=UPI00214E6D95|nr:uncharacterized protein LOC126380104 [Pectinophora gossypiella]
MGNLDLTTDIDSMLDIQCHEINSPEICKSLITKKYNFKVISLNIRSVKKNLDTLLVYIHRTNLEFDILILTECRLNDSTIIDSIPGYDSHFTLHNINQNGGVVAYTKSSWCATVTEPSFDEACCLIIDIPNVVTIFGIYRSPAFRDFSIFLSALNDNLEIHKNKKSVILAGDININTLSSESTEYLCLLAEHGFIPAITMPTRLTSCLDHGFVKSKFPAIGIVCNSDITDHKIVIVGLTTNEKRSIQRSRMIIDYDGVGDELASVDWSVVTALDNVDKAVEVLMELIKTAIANNSKEIKISRSKYVIQPWITPGLLRCTRHRDRLHAKLKQFPNDEILEITYKRYRNFHNMLLRKLRIEYEKQELQSNSGDPKLLWKTIKRICNTNKIKNCQATELTTIGANTVDSLNTCNKFFSTVGENLAKRIIQEIDVTEDQLANNVPDTNGPMDSFFLEPTDELEICLYSYMSVGCQLLCLRLG